MNIVVFGASGRIGQAIVQEALNRKHEVTAAVRNPQRYALTHERLQVIQVDLLNAASVAAAVAGKEAAISAYGPKAGHEEELTAAAESLIAGLKDAEGLRVLIVGGAGSLKTDSGELLLETADFPAAFLPLATAHARAYQLYQGSALDYTYISPPAELREGQRTGMFRIGLDRLVVDENGESSVSIPDFAAAVIDELEEGNFSRERFTVGY